MRRCTPMVILTVVTGFACGTLRADAPDDEGVTMYREDKFKGQKFHVPVGTDVVNLDDQDIPLVRKYGPFEDCVSSIRWNIPKGKCLVLYNDANYEKPELILIGKGTIAVLIDNAKTVPVNDSTSSVKWHPYPPTPYSGVPVAGR